MPDFARGGEEATRRERDPASRRALRRLFRQRANLRCAHAVAAHDEMGKRIAQYVFQRQFPDDRLPNNSSLSLEGG